MRGVLRHVASGQRRRARRATDVEQTFAGRCRVIEGYNVNTAHLLLGGSDILPEMFHSRDLQKKVDAAFAG